MPYQTIIYFLFATFVSIYNLWFADRLRKNFDAQYLNSLFYFLIAYNLGNFLNWIGPKALQLFFLNAKKPAYDILPVITCIYGIITFPILILVLYFLLVTFIELFEKRIRRWQNQLLIAAMGLAIVSLFWSNFIYFNRGVFARCESVMMAWDTFGTNFLVFTPSVFLVINLFQKSDFKRRRNMAFLLAFQFVMAVVYLTPISWLRFNWKNIQIDLLAILFFVLPLIPLWVAKIYQQKYIRLYPDSPVALPDLQTACRDFGISRRECEVLEMVIAGKSHREIEDTLFISGRTIKNHLYNSYKKLGVKNRVQLLNLFHNLQKKPQ